MSDPISWLSLASGAVITVVSLAKPYALFRMRIKERSMDMEEKKQKRDSDLNASVDRAHDQLIAQLKAELQALEIRMQVKINDQQANLEIQESKIIQQQLLQKHFSEQNNALQTLFAEAQSRATQFSGQITKLTQEFEDLKAKFLVITAENNDLHREIDDLLATCHELINQIEQLGFKPARRPRLM